MAETHGAKTSPPPATRPLSRERIREAIMDVVLSEGYEAASLEMVIDRAGVDLAEFHCHFKDFRDCYLHVYLENADDFNHALYDAFVAAPTWRDGIRAAAYGCARYIRDNPREIAFSIVQRFNVDDITQVYRERQLEWITDIVDRGRYELDDPDSMDRSVAEGVMGSIYELMIGEFQRGRGVEIEQVVPDLVYVIVRPYLGHSVATEELRIPPPPESPAEGGD